MVVEDFVEFDPLPGQVQGREGLKAAIRQIRSAFPDIHCKAVEMLAEGDSVFTRLRWSGTHRGTFLGASATGRRITFKGTVLVRLVAGRITDSRILMDTLGLLHQLGRLPLRTIDCAGIFPGRIAHDIGNLLRGVVARAELALQQHSAGVFPESELNAIRGMAIRGSEMLLHKTRTCRRMITSSKCRTRDESFVGYIGSDIDITELKRRQEEELARQKLASLGVLAGGIAHDFNNLLGSIIANSALLASDLEQNSAAQEIAKTINTVAVRASEIVRQLLVYAAGDGASADFELVDLGALVGEMFQLMRVSIGENAAFQVDLPERTSPVRGNAAQLRQVVMNLLTNASDALRGQEGLLSVTLREVPESVRGRDGNYLRLNISDTGCGMTDEICARIFDPFFTTKGAGRGLGLAAVQGIVREHGGAISVESSPGKGSCFTILLPCGQSEPGCVSISTAAQTVSNRDFDANILVIEDEESFRLGVTEMLRRMGFSVLEASDCRTGLDLFRTYLDQIDTVLLDTTLPGISGRSGREVLAELMQLRPAVKVILTLAHERERAQAAVGGSPSLVFIRKPYQVDELADLIRRTCS